MGQYCTLQTCPYPATIPDSGCICTSAFLSFFLFQFNCTLHQPEKDFFNPAMFWPPEPHVTNVTFNMELYKTDLFLAPSQGLFSVAENGPIYVEVTNDKGFQTSQTQGHATEPNLCLSVERPPYAVALN